MKLLFRESASQNPGPNAVDFVLDVISRVCVFVRACVCVCVCKRVCVCARAHVLCTEAMYKHPNTPLYPFPACFVIFLPDNSLAGGQWTQCYGVRACLVIISQKNLLVWNSFHTSRMGRIGIHKLRSADFIESDGCYFKPVGKDHVSHVVFLWVDGD